MLGSGSVLGPHNDRLQREQETGNHQSKIYGALIKALDSEKPGDQSVNPRFLSWARNYVLK